MKIFVTGATGYIGRWLVDYLQDIGHAVSYVYLIDEGDIAPRPGVSSYPYTGAAYELHDILHASKPDVVIHLAARGGQAQGPAAVLRMMEANLTFGTLLCDAMSAAGCQVLISAGSYWEFGPNGEYRPNSLYAATKKAFTDITYFYSLNNALTAVSVVLFDVFGPNDPRPKLVPDLITSLKNGTDFKVSSGENTICPIYIKDVCAAFGRVIELASGPCFHGHHVFAADTGARMSVRAFVEEFFRSVGRHTTVKWGANPTRSYQVTSPVSTLPVVPGWSPAFSLQEALRDLSAIEGLL